MITLPALYGCKYKVFEPRKCTPAAQTSIVVVLGEKVLMHLSAQLNIVGIPILCPPQAS